MTPTHNLFIRRSIEFCSHPYEGLQMIRRRKKGGKPMPQALMISGPVADRLLENMTAKLEKLVGKRNCPDLIVLPGA